MNEKVEKTIETVTDGVKSGNAEKVLGALIGFLATTGAGTLVYLGKKGFTKIRDKAFPVKEENREEKEDGLKKEDVVFDEKDK